MAIFFLRDLHRRSFICHEMIGDQWRKNFLTKVPISDDGLVYSLVNFLFGIRICQAI